MPLVCRASERGFTLTELLITMAITGVLMGAIVSSFITQRKSYVRQEQVTVMMQNVRAAMDMLVREVRMTDYGVPASLSTWIDWVAGFTSNPQIIPGSGSDPDTLTIASGFDAATLSAAANQGATTLILASSEEANWFKTDSGPLNPAKKVVFIGRNEHAVITGISGKKLTIDTDPTASGLQGLKWSYPVDTPVESLKVITYKVTDNVLKRDENTRSTPNPQPLAENIADLQVTLTGNTVTITVTGRTTNPDVDYTHPTAGDAYRRMVLASRVRLRNLGL